MAGQLTEYLTDSRVRGNHPQGWRVSALESGRRAAFRPHRLSIRYSVEDGHEFSDPVISSSVKRSLLGTLIYGKQQEYELDDRTLAHVKVVVTARLRKRESFFLSWTRRGGSGPASVSLWIAPSVPLVFRFSTAEQEKLSRRWIESLMRLSYAEHSLVITPEDEVFAPPAGSASPTAERKLSGPQPG